MSTIGPNGEELESPNPTPQVGQVWADNDERTTYPEFTILALVDRWDRSGELVQMARVQRGPRKVHIRVDRFADTGSRGYRYIGRAR
jgi:hypothetical protein